MHKVLVNAIKLGLTTAILVYLYSKGLLDFSRVKNVLTNIPVSAAALTVLTLTTLSTVVRWRMLLLGQNLNLSLIEAARLTMIGAFFNTAIPGAVSGDIVKGYYVVRQQPDGRGRIKTFTSLLLDRILGVSALVFVSFLSMLLNLNTMLESPTLRPLCGLITILFGGIVLFYALVLTPWKSMNTLSRWLRKLPAGEYFGKLFESFKTYEKCRGYVFKGLLISMAIHASVVGVFILLAGALGGFESIPLAKFFFLAPMGLLVTAVPLAPAGLGTGHAAFFGLFQLVGSSRGADLFTAFVAFQILISLSGGFFYIKYRGQIPTSN